MGRKKSPAMLPEKRPDFFPVGLRDAQCIHFRAGEEAEPALRMIWRKRVELRLKFEKKHKPVSAAIIATFGNNSRQVEVRWFYRSPNFLARLPASCRVWRFTEIGIQ